ncbi:fibronectin type III domain-containing protein, partial [bacterium]|nr:fibronectin type III domain-containing protein [bacterium]
GPSNTVVEKGTSFSEVIAFSDQDDTPVYSLDLGSMTCDEEAWGVALSIDGSTGLLSGTPDFTSTCSINVSIASGANSASHLISFTSQDTSAPNTPSAFSMTSPLTSPSTNNTPSFDVTVSEVGGSVRLYSDASCTVHVENFTVTGTSQTITVSAPLADNSYDFSVTHIDDSGNESSCFGVSAALMVDTAAPEDPTNLVVAEYTNDLKGSVLSFDASVATDVNHYLIKIEDDAAAELVGWTQVNATSYQHGSNLGLAECSKSYRYIIKTVDNAGSESSEVASSYFFYDNTAPGVVSSITNLANTEVNGSEEHAFNPASDNCNAVGSYQIAVSSSVLEANIITGWEYQAVSTNPYRIYTSETLVEGNFYYSLIRAVDKAGNIGAVVASGSWQLPGPPTAVDSVTIISKTTESIQLGWNEPNNGGREITDYLVEYKETASSTWLAYNDGFSNDIVLSVEGLNSDTSYDFRVTSWNGNFAPTPSPVSTDSTFVDIPFFEPNSFKLMNIGGATQTAVVAFEDTTEIKLDGVVIANLNAGETHEFASTLNQVLDADKPIFAAGKVTGINGNWQDGNVVWSGKDWAGSSFVFTLTRNAPHFLGIYSFEAGNNVVLRAPNPANDIVITLGEGEYQSFDLPDLGGFTLESTGLLVAFTYSHENQNKVIDPKPILPASTDIIGIPSRSVKVTTNSPTASIDYYHGDDITGTTTVNKGTAKSIAGRSKFSNSNSQYRAQPLRMISTEPLVGNSNADSDGYCSAPFVPTVLMKKRFATNVSAQYVAFASIYDAVIDVYYPDGTTAQVALSRTGSSVDSPYSAYFTNVPAGTRFEADKRMQGWYEPDTYNFSAKDDETIMIGYD